MTSPNSSASPSAFDSRLSRLPFFYGWVVVASAFITMGIGVNVRTSFSLLFPSILSEFGWDRATTAAAFSIGFASAGAFSPIVGRVIQRLAPRYVFSLAAIIVAAGMVLTTFITQPWHAYISLGFMVVGVSVVLSYVGHSMVLPNWFTRKRGFAIGLAFSGVGIGSIMFLPLVQQFIDQEGWRYACWAMAAMMVAIVVPINLMFQRFQPQDMGLSPDGDIPGDEIEAGARPVYDNVVNKEWAGTEWTLALAIRTRQFWWFCLSFFMGLYIWYGVLVHQTKYLVDIGISATEAAFVLGLVGFAGVMGQILLGYISDRVGRELMWSLSALGFGFCYLLLLLMKDNPAPVLIYLMAISQGLLGYGMASVYGAMPADVFQGRNYGVIFGTLSLAALSGGAFGPWAMGYMYDQYGNYDMAFLSGIGAMAISIGAVWMAAPRKIRLVAGQAEKRHKAQASS